VAEGGHIFVGDLGGGVLTVLSDMAGTAHFDSLGGTLNLDQARSVYRRGAPRVSVTCGSTAGSWRSGRVGFPEGVPFLGVQQAAQGGHVFDPRDQPAGPAVLQPLADYRFAGTFDQSAPDR
jgi:hypothetical protein